MATITAITNSVSNVQAAITSAATGDTVIIPTIPSASVSWSGDGPQVPSTKGLTIDFTGVTLTHTGTGQALVVYTNATTPSRVTGGSFIETGGNNLMVHFLQASGNFTNQKFRLDHATFYSTIAVTFVEVDNCWGLIDHVDMTAWRNAEMIHNYAWGAGVTTGWGETVTWDDGDALYIEDSIFTNQDQTSGYHWGCAAVQSYYGSRTTFRYNTMNYVHLDQHGTGTNVGARVWCIYENVFNTPTSGSVNQSDFMAIRAGSGVIFNNRRGTGINSGAGVIVLYEEDSGYPATYQIGRGKDQALDPAYCWNNFTTPVSGSSNVVDGRDFYSNTAKGGFTPYTYPHPLQGAADTTAPLVTSIIIATNGTTCTIGFNETVTHGAGGSSGWTPTLSGGAVTWTYSSGAGTSSLVGTLNRTVVAGETGTFAYTQPGNGVEDSVGNDLVTMSGSIVTNLSTQNLPSTVFQRSRAPTRFARGGGGGRR